MKRPLNHSLSDNQIAVLRDKATEAPFSGKFLHVTDDGTYTCANCYAPLFASYHKFDAHCGWPSFDDALPGSVEFIDDASHGMKRTEVTCKNCGGHLGHIFDDGPTETTGQRYCINSLAIDFHKKQR